MKPILYSTEMVKAILDGRKTQTRRVVKPDIVSGFDVDVDGSIVAYIDQATGDSFKPGDIAPYLPGDILYVRETWQDMSDNKGEYVYLADGDKGLFDKDWGVVTTKEIKWRPSIHMPREAVRLFLLVRNVRVERVQDITEEDVLAEGCGLASWTQDDWPKTAGFAQLWDSLNAKRGYGWKNNDWVWVIEFERTEATTDEI